MSSDSMAETRSKVLKELEESFGGRITALEEIVTDQSQMMKDFVADQNAKMEKNIQDMFKAIRLANTLNVPVSSLKQGMEASEVTMTPLVHGEYSDAGRDIRSDLSATYGAMTRLGKVDFPRFNGEHVVDWIFKAEEFFSIDQTPNHFKIKIATIHFDGPAAKWHQSNVQSGFGKSVRYDWEAFKTLLQDRFEDVLEDPIAELKQLQETDGIVNYHEKFEMIKTRLDLPEDYLVSAYLAGLRIDTQMHVRMFRPLTVKDCLMLGRLYEKAHPRRSGSTNWSSSKEVSNNMGSKGLLPSPKDTEGKFKQSGSHSGAGQTYHKNNNVAARNFLSQEEMSARRAKGLCYFCDENYTPEHYLQHKKTQLFSLDVDDDLEDDEEYKDAGEEFEGKPIPQISVNAVSGVSDYNTMRVRGTCSKRTLFFLIDSNSTHNFIDSTVAEKLGCTVQPARLTRVSVADGRKLEVKGKIDGFQWNFQTTPFKDDVMMIPLQGVDVVLGVQWLESLGPITWEFKKLEMGFVYNQVKVMLHGIRPDSVRAVRSQKINKVLDRGVQISMLCVQEVVDDDGTEGVVDEWTKVEEEVSIPDLYTLNMSTGDEVVPAAVGLLLEKFTDIFVEPSSLPPFRQHHDHKIVLREGSNPVNQRPYRYALHQKNEIDKIVEEMLLSGTIQPSSSPYASPVVLVKKKDSTWRLCVDYRELNGMTVKDRFPIPLIEDLLDELGESKVYSKIDLRAGYHQVRMEVADIHKTAFKTHSGHFEYLVMPFGLTNAPATFQSLMNSVFKVFLRKFVLIFFDDILIYSNSLEDHVQHLELVFEVMRSNKLFAKMSKCAFAVDRVEYLGHFISAQGIATDPAKVKAVKDWPEPKTLKQLRGFLGLAGYYRRFVRHFGGIASPLHGLTKTDSFIWSPEAHIAFDKLKTTLCEAPVLALPLFDKLFVVETDACGQGIGAVLMQDNHPVAYISRQLKGKQLHLSIYEKELLAVIFAVRKWRHYLLPAHFIIKTDQRSLKYLLEQRLNTPIQQQWLPKLLEFDYEIQYKQGKENVVADALSRVEGSEILHMAMSVMECDLMKDIQNSYATDVLLQDIISALKSNPDAKKHYSWTQEVLRRKSKIVVPNKVELKNTILQWLHGSGVGGHSGRDATHQKVKGIFYWKGMSKDIQQFIRSCTVCQQCKSDHSVYPGLLQPLSVPDTIWSDVSMDFIDGLPLSAGKEVIMVVVDRLSKATHFIALFHPYSAMSVAQAYLDNVYKLHGCPNSIVSDRDKVFTSEFWREFFTLQGVAL